MKYFTISITILKIIYDILFTTILTTNSNNSNIYNEDILNFSGAEVTILLKLDLLNQPLIEIFPFFSLIGDLCINSNRKSHHGVDYLNLGECKTIKRFQLIHNKIKEVPEYIISFKHIEYLCLYDNELTSSCFDKITQLTTLRILDLRHNSIEEIPNNIGNLVNLEELLLGRNSFTHIITDLSNFKLKILELTGIRVKYNPNGNLKRNIVFKMINDFLKIESLEDLTLNYNDLSKFNFDNNEYYIKTLKLMSCNLHRFPNSIRKLKQLEYLDLRHNKFTVIPSILSVLENLKELMLIGNSIISYINIYFHSLETLHIQWNWNLTGVISIKNTFSSSLQHPNIYIYTNDYTKVNFESSTIKHLKGLYQYGNYNSKILEYINTLKSLEFLHIEGEFDVSVIDFISELKNLRKLHFGLHTYKKFDFLSILFPALKNLKNLESLSLEEYVRNILLDDKICDLKSPKELYITRFFVKNIVNFSKFKNLKFICFEYINFCESKEEINFFLKQNKIKVEYKNCLFESIIIEKLKR